jgi:hypothetical protein
MIPNYQYGKCCKTCQFYSPQLHPVEKDNRRYYEFKEICSKYLAEIETHGWCPTYQLKETWETPQGG